MSEERKMKQVPPRAWLYRAEYSSGSYSPNYFEWRVTLNEQDTRGAVEVIPLVPGETR